LLNVDGKVMALTRSLLLSSPDQAGNLNFDKITLPPPENYENKVSLFKTLWVIHSVKLPDLPESCLLTFWGLL